MKKFQLDINLLKLDKACILSVQGKQAKVKGVFIPIQENDIFIKVDENLKAKGAYLSLTAWESREDRFGKSHFIKQNFSRDYRAAHTEEELKQKPILGNGRFIESVQTQSQPIEAQHVNAIPDADDDLPF